MDMPHATITVHFTNGDDKSLMVDWDSVNLAPVVRRDDGILRFGRTQDGEWFELLAAPETSVLYWGRFV